MSMTAHENIRCQARAAIFKALGHPTRLYILEKLKDSPHCVCELTDLIGADTSTVSKHLTVLRNAGLVTSRKEKTTVYYSLTCSCLIQFLDGAEALLKMKAAADQAALETPAL